MKRRDVLTAGFALAAGGGVARFHTVDIDGTPYRIETTPLRSGGALQKLLSAG